MGLHNPLTALPLVADVLGTFTCHSKHTGGTTLGNVSTFSAGEVKQQQQSEL
jgi:hypothetical protein